MWRRQRDGKCVRVRCAIAQGGSCGVGKQGKRRFRSRDAPTRGSVTWVPSRDTATEYCHRPPITGYRHRTLPQDTVTGYRHRIPTQDTDTEHPSLEALPRISATDKCHRSLSRINITAAYNRVDVGSYPQHLSLHRTYGSRIRRYIHIGERKL